MHRPCKALGQLPQSVQGVEVRALPIPGQGLTVQLDTVDCLQTGDVKIAANTMEQHERTCAMISYMATLCNGNITVTTW